MATPPDAARQSRFSDPGAHAALLRDVPDDLESLSRASRNVIVHYRAQLPELTPERVPEINSRWLAEILRRDQARFDSPLLDERPLADRVAGCCRDHSLFLVGALRQRGIPARSRVGFATYLSPGWAIDHVIVEHLQDGRRVRSDPEFTAEDVDFDPRDMGGGLASPHHSAAEAWLAYRAGELDLSHHAVFPGATGPMAGEPLVRRYLSLQAAHRFSDETLLWDSWGDGELDDAEADRFARLLVAADSGDAAAEQELYNWCVADPRLAPGATVRQHRLDGSGFDLVELG